MSTCTALFHSTCSKVVKSKTEKSGTWSLHSNPTQMWRGAPAPVGTVLPHKIEGAEDRMMSCCGLQPRLDPSRCSDPRGLKKAEVPTRGSESGKGYPQALLPAPHHTPPHTHPARQGLLQNRAKCPGLSLGCLITSIYIEPGLPWWLRW